MSLAGERLSRRLDPEHEGVRHEKPETPELWVGRLAVSGRGRVSCRRRDVHYSRGFTCETCHGDMTAVANPQRNPWVDEPRCGSCHTRSGFEFEQPNTLFQDSKGHSNVHCEACHGSPHAITPTVNPQDNVQAIAMRGHAGVINTCTVCHTRTPDESFFHRVGD